jgi:hypothetical protein
LSIDFNQLIYEFIVSKKLTMIIKLTESMKKLNILFILLFVAIMLPSCTGKKEIMEAGISKGNLSIGWAVTSITPDKAVDLRGQFPARISEGILDPVTATVLAIESGQGTSSVKATLVSVDLVSVEMELLDAVRAKLKDSPGINTDNIIMNATHTHTAPFCSPDNSTMTRYGIELDVIAPSDYLDFAASQISAAIKKAWSEKKPGGISYGLGHAVVGHNRLRVDFTGKSLLYGNTNIPEFSHMEGYEDHSVNLLYTWDQNSKLTGIVVNVPCPSQATEGMYQISADYWHDTRVEIHKRLGEGIYILPQCGAGGDQSPHILLGGKAEDRMQKLMFGDSISTGRQGMARRKQIAVRIADAVTSVLPYMKNVIEWSPVMNYQKLDVELSRRLIGLEDVNKAVKESKEWQAKYDNLLKEIKNNPSYKEKKRWYTDVTNSYRRLTRGQSVKDRFELEKVQPKMPIEIHVLRLGEIAMATNPFELYLDFGIRMKGRSPAVQTFLVNLSNGSFGYLPPKRSTAGGSYGAEPASTLIGPEGGQELVEATLASFNAMWKPGQPGEKRINN